MKYYFKELFHIYKLRVAIDEYGKFYITRNGEELKIHKCGSNNFKIWFSYKNKSKVLSAQRVIWSYMHSKPLDDDDYITNISELTFQDFENWKIIKKRDLLKANRERRHR